MNRTSRARQLRRDSTDAEQRLWSVLRDRQLAGDKVRRQTPIGPYIADFLCMQRRLVIELDGGQHQQRADSDRERTRFLESRGYRVLRFWNNDVFDDLESVVDAIRLELQRGPPHPNPLPREKGSEFPLTLTPGRGDQRPPRP